MNTEKILGRILGIDYGQRRIGMAISDPLRITAQALPTINVRDKKLVINEIEKLVHEKEVKEIVVGMPFNLNGQKGVTAQEVDEFICQLSDKLKIPVHSWDERWSTIAAHKTIWELGKSPSRNKEKVDQISAQLILQNYLDYLSYRK